MALDALFLKALDETVEEIQGYSKEQLDFELMKSKNSSFATTIDFLKKFKEEFELSLYIDEIIITNSFDLYSLINSKVELLDFSYLPVNSAMNEDCYLMAA